MKWYKAEHCLVSSADSGPLDTDMHLQARTTTADPNVKKSFTDMFAQGQLLTCEESCAKMMKLLLDDKYTSGDHVDIYDV